ncbi:MAG: hypothetical protein ABI671_16205 [Burkholderiales bacterium]
MFSSARTATHANGAHLVHIQAITPTPATADSTGFGAEVERARPGAHGMNRRDLIGRTLALAAGAAGFAHAGEANTRALSFRGTAFLHRWSKDAQHEFTPAPDTDLKSWHDMITLNLHSKVRQGEQLADVANQVLGNYQRHGKILQTRSTPRTAARPAEHLIVAVLGTPQLLECSFARCMLHEGVGLVAVVSHRVYGPAAGPEMKRWLAAQGQANEQALMAWAMLPSPDQLNRLPPA